jgi:hypothetical protein
VQKDPKEVKKLAGGRVRLLTYKLSGQYRRQIAALLTRSRLEPSKLQSSARVENVRAKTFSLVDLPSSALIDI